MSNLLASAMHDINRARLKLEVAKNEYKPTACKAIVGKYVSRLQWITDDFLAQKFWSREMRQAISKDLRSDCLTSEAVLQKLDYLSAEDRARIEDTIDAMVLARKQAAQLLHQQIKQI